MVKAIKKGRKTQTRRLSDRWDRVKPGDILWVRETWQVMTGKQQGDLGACVRYRDLDLRPCFMPADKAMPLGLTWDRWRPSIHMPRWAARILLRAVRVRREPLQQITAADCEAEGIVVPPVDYTVPEDPRVLDFEREEELRDQYRELWIKLNGAASWKANPEVRVVEFSVEPEGA